VLVLGDAVRLDDVEALAAPEEDGAVARAEVAGEVELTSLQAVGDRVALRLLGRRVEARHAPIAAHPEPAGCVDGEAVHRGAGQPIGLGEVLDLARGAVHAIQPVDGADPQRGGLRLEDGMHRRSTQPVLAKRIRVPPPGARVVLHQTDTADGAGGRRAEQQLAVERFGDDADLRLLALADGHRRRERTRRRIDALQPLLIGTDPDFSRAIGVHGERIVVRHAAVLRRERREASRRRIEPAHAARPGRDPDLPEAILRDREHRVGVEIARLRGVALELPGRAVEAVQATAVRGDPDVPACVLEEPHHRVVAQARGVAGDRSEAADRIAVLARDVDATGEGADPQRTAAIREQRPDGAAVQSRGIVGIEPVVDETPRPEVEVIEAAVLGADPQPARAVEQQGVHRVDREAVRILGIVLIEREAAGAAIDLRQPAVHHRHVDRAVGILDEGAHVLALEQER
jgi:hypothetical protein